MPLPPTQIITIQSLSSHSVLLLTTSNWRTRLETNRIKCCEKDMVQTKGYKKTPEEARRRSWMRNVWLQIGQKHMTRELLKSLVEREHAWRENFKGSLKKVAISQVETDRSFQMKENFSKNTCLKTFLHNIYLWARKHISSEYFFTPWLPSFKTGSKRFLSYCQQTYMGYGLKQ